jgi:hypothetical protein
MVGDDEKDATIAALDLGAAGHVPWWPRPDVTLFKVPVHVLTETNRHAGHAGHADILREQPDGSAALDAGSALPERGPEFWAEHRAGVERAAAVADPTRG